MNDSHNTNLSREQLASPSRLSTSMFALLAVLLYLMLVDAVVETLVSGSPLRWIVTGVVAGYLVLSGLLWRKLNWETKASVSLIALLALTTFAAWYPEGSDSAITLFRQKVSTLLSGVTALGILLAGWILARFKFLPWLARVVLLLLAAYGVAAFVVGIATRTPYAALLHGASLSVNVPFWLQGAFIGAAVVVPVALLLHLVNGVSQIRTGQLRDWSRQMLALGLCGAITVSGVRTGSAFAASPALSPAGSSSGTTPWPSLPEPDPDLKATLDALRRLQAKTNSETYDISAAAQLIGPDVEKTLAFLRDNFSFDPYRGSLRGAQGTLMARGGNALDLSQLMCALLTVHGYPVRLVHGMLSDSDGQRLLNRAKLPPRLPVVPSVTADQAAQVSGLPVENLRRLNRAAETQSRELTRTLQERMQRDTASIEQFLRNSQIQLQPAPGPTLDDVRSHVWVQTQIDGEWRDLDPSFPDSKLGQRFAEPEGEIPVDTVPDEWVQALRLRVLTNYEGTDQPSEVLNVRLRVPDLAGKSILLGFVPADGGETSARDTANAFRALLIIGSRQDTGATFYLDAAKAPASGPGGLFGSALSEGEPQHLNRASLEITLEAPGLTPTQVTRTIIASPDRAGADATARIAQARQQLVTVYQFVVAGGALSPEWVGASYLSFLEQFEKTGPETMEMIPLDLLNLAIAATRPEMGELAGHPKQMRRYFKQPLVVGQRLRLRQGPAGRTVFVKSVDILFNRSETTDPLEMVRQGVLETHLERLIMEGMEVANTTVVFERSRASILVLRPGQSNNLAQLHCSAEAKRGISEDLSAGYVVIVPSERVEIAGSPQIGWWRVLPQGGETLGRMESGEGQALSERVGYMAVSYTHLTLPTIYSV